MSKQKIIESKYDPDNFFLKAFNYDVWFENENRMIKKNQLIKKNFLIKNNLLIYHQCQY